MTKRILIGLTILLATQFLSAKTKPIYGYFITKENDTVDCKFDIPFYKTKSGELKLEFRDIQYKLIARLNDGTHYKVTPKDYNGFGFAYEYKQFDYRSFNNTVNTKGDKIFLRVDIDGKLKLISHFVRVPVHKLQSPNATIYIEVEDVRYRREYIQKDNGDLIQYNKSFFKKGLAELLSDYPELANKIGKTDYEYDNTLRVIMEYNEHFSDSSY